MINTEQSNTSKNYLQIPSQIGFENIEKTTIAAKKAFPDLVSLFFNPVTIGIFIILALVKPELLLTALIISFLFVVCVHCARQMKKDPIK